MTLINLGIRNSLKHKEQEHISFINNNISSYLSQEKQVFLFSFCQHEGDEEMLQKIYKTRPNDFKDGKISTVKYRGNIIDFLNLYQQMEYMLCERFHSLVLSYALKQRFYVISYSKKIDNVIEELNLGTKFTKFEDINSHSLLSLSDFSQVDEINLRTLHQQSQKQFAKLDEFLL